MNAPTASAALAPNVVMVDVGALKPSSTHIQVLRRQRFKSEAIAELAESIRAAGVLQPILARPIVGGHHEIVAGERRWLASKKAGLTQMPVSVRELSDEQVLEIQLIENLQREGLHELEEAEGYYELKKLKGIDEETIADMVGKSKSYVQKRAKLLSLCPEARQAFYGGALDFSRALLIARIGHHDTQREALKHVTKGEFGRGPMTFKEASAFILKNYMLRLKSAPFDTKDANLVPKAGSCVKCPKRTGNQSDLFGDVKDADTCTDPKCYDEKRDAGMSAERVALEAKGKKVIHGAEAKKIFPQWDSEHEWSRNNMVGGYQKISDSTWVTGKQKKISEILPDDFEPILVQHPGTGAIVKLATQQAVSSAAAKLSRSAKKKSKAKASPASSGKSAEQRELDDRVRELTDQRVLKAVFEKSKGIGQVELEALAWQLWDDVGAITGMSKDLAAAVGSTAKGSQMPKMTAKDRGRFAVACLATLALEGNHFIASAFAPVFKSLKVDRKQIEKDVRAELKQAQEAKAKKK